MLNRKFGALNLWQAALFFVLVLVAVDFLAGMVAQRMEDKKARPSTPNPTNNSNNAGGGQNQTDAGATKENGNRQAY